MALPTVENAQRYFRVDYSCETRTITILTEDTKTQSASTFLSTLKQRVDEGGKIDIAIKDRSLRAIVTSVVSGYEAKRGLLQRIWDCFLKIFCCSTNLDVLESLASEIQNVDVILGCYSAQFFRTELNNLIAFLTKLPQPQAQEFFEAQRKLDAENPHAVQGKFVTPYRHPNDASKPCDLTKLSARELIDVAKEICWCARAYERAYTYNTEQYHRDYLKPIKEVSAQAHPSLFQDIESSATNTLSSRANEMCLLIAKAMDGEAKLSEAARALSYVNSPKKEDEKKLIYKIVRQCLAEGEIQLAVYAISRVYFEEKKKILLEIAKQALANPGQIERNIPTYLSICEVIGSETDSLLLELIDQLCRNGKYALAYELLVKYKDKLSIQTSDAWLLKIGNVCLTRKEYRTARSAAGQVLSDWKNKNKLKSAIVQSYQNDGDWDSAYATACEILRDQNMTFETRNVHLETIAIHYEQLGQMDKATDVRSAKRT